MARRLTAGDSNSLNQNSKIIREFEERELEDVAFKAGILPPRNGNAAAQTRTITNDMPLMGGRDLPDGVDFAGGDPGEKVLTKLFKSYGTTHISFGAAAHYKNIGDLDNATKGMGDMLIGVDLPFTGTSRGKGWTSVEVSYTASVFASFVCTCKCVIVCVPTTGDDIIGDLKKAIAGAGDFWYSKSYIRECCGVECDLSSPIITVSTGAISDSDSKDGAVLYFQGEPSAENLAAAKEALRADLHKSMGSAAMNLATQVDAVKCSPLCDGVR